MNIWAIADLHLKGMDPRKTMDKFGPAWSEHAEKISKDWISKVSSKDLVLIAGDISWATKLPKALEDLQWIGSLPGHKVLIKGNHDYWWPSAKKLRENLPPSVEAISTEAILYSSVAIAGTRLWDSPEYDFLPFIEIKNEGKGLTSSYQESDKERFERELIRLENSLKTLPQDDDIMRIAMTHYPPITHNLTPSRASALFEKYRVKHVIFGHLHSVKANSLPFGESKGIHYHLTSCDYLDFSLKKIDSLTDM